MMTEATTLPASNTPSGMTTGGMQITEPVAPGQQQQQAPATPAMPEGGLEKFYNKESGAYDWSNHVKELNYRLTQNRQQPAQQPQNTQQQPQNNGDTAAGGNAQEIVQQAGLDWDALENKVGAQGSLDDADYAALEKAGVPRRVVDNYLEAYKLATESVATKVADRAGGQQQLDQLMQWASGNLTAAEKAEYNRVLQTSEWHIAIDALKDRRTKVVGERGNTIHGNNVADTTPVAFKNESEMSEAMSKKNDRGQVLYRVDPNYRKQVDQRLLASNFSAARGTFGN